MAYCDIEKGWPNVHVVDKALPVAEAQKATLKEGMVIHNDGGVWKMGCPNGFMPYITTPEQSPTALDVERNVSSDFGGFPGGSGEMGRQYMGGVCLNNALEIVTDQFDGLTGGELVRADPADGQLKVAGSNQILGQCVEVSTDEYGRTLARILTGVVLRSP